MIIFLKGSGLVIALTGLLIALLDILGKFRDREKVEFARLLREVKVGLPRTTPGFTKFLKAFPPPVGVTAESISSTAKDVMQTHEGFSVSIAVRYFANGQRTAPVATYAEVLAWAEKTRQKWWSLLVGVLGWVMVAAAFVLEMQKVV